MFHDLVKGPLDVIWEDCRIGAAVGEFFDRAYKVVQPGLMSYESIFFCRSDVNSTHAISLGTRGLVFRLHRLGLTDANLLLFCGHLERSSLLVSVSVGVSCTGIVSSDALNHVSVHVWELLS